jgi:hypothetical protein
MHGYLAHFGRTLHLKCEMGVPTVRPCLAVAERMADFGDHGCEADHALYRRLLIDCFRAWGLP